jgi:hypothetical protein
VTAQGAEPSGELLAGVAASFDPHVGALERARASGRLAGELWLAFRREFDAVERNDLNHAVAERAFESVWRRLVHEGL